MQKLEKIVRSIAQTATSFSTEASDRNQVSASNEERTMMVDMTTGRTERASETELNLRGHHCQLNFVLPTAKPFGIMSRKSRTSKICDLT